MENATGGCPQDFKRCPGETGTQTEDVCETEAQALPGAGSGSPSLVRAAGEASGGAVPKQLGVCGVIAICKIRALQTRDPEACSGCRTFPHDRTGRADGICGVEDGAGNRADDFEFRIGDGGPDHDVVGARREIDVRAAVRPFGGVDGLGDGGRGIG